MKLTLKTLKGEVMNIEIDSQATVRELKEKVQQLKNIDVDHQKIVYKGKATKNSDILKVVGVKDNDFLAVMTVAKQSESKMKEEEPKEKKVEEKASEKPVIPPPTTEIKPPPQINANQDPEFENKISGLLAMGFDRENCVAALRAAFGNTDRAVEYLINGIPQVPQGGQMGQGSPMMGGGLGGMGGLGGLGGMGGGLGGFGGMEQQTEALFRGLVNHPGFAQIKQLIRNNPSSLPLILQPISQASPELYQIIAQNPETFQRVIMEDGGQEGQGMVPPPPPPVAIQVTPEEAAAIERLVSLGFSKIDAAQAYFACDKNEQLAANILFDRLANGDIDPLPEEGGNQGGNEGGQQGGNGGGQQGNNDDDDDDNLFN